MNIKIEKIQNKDKQTWHEFLPKYVIPGKIVEFGCGSGFVLDFLSKNFKNSIIIGIDKDEQRLAQVVERKLKNVIPIREDITEKIFPRKSLDTALFIACLHEVFSHQGKEKVKACFRIAHDVLKDNGVLIIQDFLRPMPKLVTIGFKTTHTRKIFYRFTKEFRPRKIKFIETKNSVKLDIADVIEFISKLRASSEEIWKQEMTETHFAFTKQDFQQLAQQNGFVIKDTINLLRSQNWSTEISKEIEFKFQLASQWIQLVMKKSKK